MGSNDGARIRNALELEKIRRTKAIESANQECDLEVNRFVNGQAARGVLLSGMTGARIAELHVARAKNVIDRWLELRRTAIREVPEIRANTYFDQLKTDLEHTAAQICNSIQHHVQKHGTAVATSGNTVAAHESLKLKAYVDREVEILRKETELARLQSEPEAQPAAPAQKQPLQKVVQTLSADPRRVFVVYGRNLAARDAMFAFLRAINLDPIEWSEAVALTGSGSPFTGEVLERALGQASAVVVLITGDDLSRLGTRFQQRDDPPFERDLTPQARPNVLFEAGMAFGRHPERTILVSFGRTRPFSDVAGRNEIRISNRAEDRQALVSRLKIAGCDVRTDHKTDWLHAGDFEGLIQPPDSSPSPVTPGSEDEITDKEEIDTFTNLRKTLNPNHSWTPQVGSRDDRIAERLVKRGWLSRGQFGYRIERLFG